MMPLKNGVILNLKEYGVSHRADVYELPGFGWLFRVNNLPCRLVPEGEQHFDVVDTDMWFEKHRMHGTLVVPNRACRITPRGLSMIEEASHV